MAKKSFFLRYVLIIKKIKQHKYCSFENIRSYLQEKTAIYAESDDQYFVNFSLRTFQREIKEIESIFGIQIVYSKKEKGYTIESELGMNQMERFLEEFEILQTINLAGDLQKYILTEQKTGNSDYISEILSSIKQGKILQFHYKKFNQDESSIRMCKPLAVREFNLRWYLIAEDTQDQVLKTFGLDRMSFLKITQKDFQYPDLNVEEYFKDCFGITRYAYQEPEEIIIFFDKFQSNYVLSLALHESQKKISEELDGSIFSFFMCITPDFIMELLSKGPGIQVIKPDHLVETIKKNLQQSLELYNKPI